MNDQIPDISGMEFKEPDKVLDDIRSKYGFEGELSSLYANNRGRLIHKWHHYIPYYDRYFSPYKDSAVRILEIGVSKGGSLDLWRNYFGSNAVIYGIDIDPVCAELNGISAQVRIGSQSDPAFLDSVVSQMGGIDIVLDDGSHQMTDVRFSFNHLFPKLRDGGTYFIEDLHTAYWEMFGGGYSAPSNFFNMVREIIDDMHHWYHQNRLKHDIIAGSCPGIHIHDSIAVFEKGRVYPPVHSQIK